MYLPSASESIVTGPLLARDDSSGGHSDVPIAAIVGGTLGGVALAILAVVGWKLWGRSIRRQAEADRKRRLEAMKAKSESPRPSLSRIPRESIEKMTQTGYLPPPNRRPTSASSNKKVEFTHSEGRNVKDDVAINGRTGASTRKAPSQTSQLRAKETDPKLVSRPRPIQPGTSPRRKPRKAVPPVPPLPPNLVKPSTSARIQQSADSSNFGEKGSNSAGVENAQEDGTTSGDVTSASTASAPISRGLRRNGNLTGNQRASVASKNSGSEQSSRWSWRYLITNAPLPFRQSGIERNRLSEATASMRSWRAREENPQVPVGAAYGGDEEYEYPQAYIDFADEESPTRVGNERANGHQ